MLRAHFKDYGKKWIPEPVPDDADLGGVELVEYVLETAPWFLDYGITPDGRGFDQQSRRWVKAMKYYMQELEYNRWLALPPDEKKQYKSRPQKEDELAGWSEW